MAVTKFSRPQPLQVTAPGQQIGQQHGGGRVAGDGAVPSWMAGGGHATRYLTLELARPLCCAIGSELLASDRQDADFG